MFGGFGSSNPTTPFGGGFGATNTTTFGQPSTNTFGTPTNTFGSTPSTPSFGTGFGTSTGFGQPSTTTGFGATNTPSFGTSFGTTTSGFGTGFGATSTTGFGQPTSPGGFGTPSTTPSTGFGATSTPSTGLFGSSTFGSQPPSTGLFGSTAPSTGGLFGSTPSTTAPSTTTFGGTFGSTTPSTGFGFGATAPSNTGFGLTGTQSGTGNPPYKPTPDPDSGTGPALNMVSLTAMQNYQGKSFEELRWEDYQLKKNTGNFSNTMSTGPAFGTSLGTAPSTGTGLFGNTPAFGTQPTTAPSTSTTGFGFGSTAPSTGGLFGSTFGSTPSTSTTGFGSTTPTSTFGSTPSAFGGSTTSPFGTTTSNPTSTFGQPNSTTSTFGQPSTSTSSFNFGSNFGTTNPSTGSSFSFPGQQPTAQSTSAPSFSFSNTPSTGATTTSSSFMPSSNNVFSTPNNSSSFFGSNAPSLSSFGTPSNSGVQTGLFGPSPSLGTPSLGFNLSSNPSSNSGFGTGFPSLTGVQPKQATITGSPFGTVPVPTLSVNGAPPSPAPSTGATITPTTNKVKKTAPSPHFKLTPRSAAKMKPRGFTATSSLGKQGLEATMSPDIFVPRESIKKLTIDMSVSEEEPEKPVKQIQSSSSSSVVSTISKETRSFGGSASPINLSGLNSSHITPQSTPQNKSAITPVTEIIQKPIAKRGPIEQQTLSSIKKVESPISSVEVPKLNRPGYWMSPRADELCRYSSEQLSAVENFTIGLEDVGSVQFVGQTDVRNLDLDKIVEFSRGEIVVYPDEHLKPPVGEGLNKTAVITLHGCFPLDRATMRPKLDEDSLSRYEAKILKSTSKLGATFINYDKRSGNWVFQVQHFSRYGLLDDSEDEEENTNTTTSKLQQYGSMVMDKFPISQPVFTTPTPNRFKIGESDSEIEDQNEQPLAEEVS